MSSARSKVSSEPRRIVINDASCLIDLNKVGLVEVMLQLPYRFVVALPVAHNELLDFTEKDCGVLRGLDWNRLISIPVRLAEPSRSSPSTPSSVRRTASLWSLPRT